MTYPGQVNQPVLTTTLLLLLVAGGFAIACYASYVPVDGHPDPIAYMEAAQNLLNGRGLVAVERLMRPRRSTDSPISGSLIIPHYSP